MSGDYGSDQAAPFYKAVDAVVQRYGPGWSTGVRADLKAAVPHLLEPFEQILAEAKNRWDHDSGGIIEDLERAINGIKEAAQ